MSEKLQTLSQHFQELRKSILLALLFFSIGVAICIPISPLLFSFLQRSFTPFSLEKSAVEIVTNKTDREAFYTLEKGETLLEKDSSVKLINKTLLLPPKTQATLARKEEALQLIALSPLDGISVLMRMSFLAGALISFPFWTGAFLRFLLPALKQAEKTFAQSFFVLSFLFLLLGLAFGYLVLIPSCQSALLAINSEIALNRWALLPYFDFCLMLLFASCLCFQAWAATLLLIRAGVLSYEQLKRGRRGVILGSFIVGALLTPPDVLSQVIVAVPLIAMFELSLLLSKVSK